jgi:hypothetical protein
MRRRTLLALLAVATVVTPLALPAASSARTTSVAVGIGDQRAEIFDNQYFKALRVRKARYFIRWDAIRSPTTLAQADAYVAAARRNRVSVFMHISTNSFVRGRARLPTVAQYRRDVGRLVRRYRRQGVREWGTWNEANHDTQPTFRSARRAAQFYLAMRRFCRGCTIVGLDVLDQRSTRNPRVDFRRYTRDWFRAAGSAGRTMRAVGFHNYSEVNRRYTRNTRDLLRVVRRYNRRAQIWYTETGGLAEFGRSFPCNLRRQADRTRYMFTMARRFRRDVKRLYPYNVTGTDCSTRFDAGLLNADGSPRPAYTVFAREARSFRR